MNKMQDKQLDNELEKDMSCQTDAQADGNQELEWMIRAGITDGSRPEAYATRQETAIMIAAALRYWTSCVLRILHAEVGEG